MAKYRRPDIKYKKHKTPKSLAPYLYMLTFAVVGTVLVISSFAASSTTGVYSGVFAGGRSDLSDVTAFEAQASKKVSIVNSFSSWGASDNSLKTNFLNNVRNHGSIPMVTWEPWNTSGGVNQPTYSLKSIIDGEHDAYITSWAQSVKSWNHALFLRFAHEMNGNWYPWSEQVNGNQAGQYVQAWRHVYNIFEQVGANKKVTWAWCVNKIYSGSTDINSLYPGDKYVDWTGFDAYNRGTAPGASGNQYGSGSWQTFAQLAKPTYQAINAIASGKPQILAEFGAVEEGGDKADWFRRALKYELKENYPRIKAVVYFNQNKIYNNLIDSSPESLAAYQESIGLSYYSSNNYGVINTKSDTIPGKVNPLLFDAQASDTTGPFVSFTGALVESIPVGSSLTISANVIDRSEIDRVEISANDKIICTDSTEDYGCQWTAPSVPQTVVVRVLAFDKLGNRSQASGTYSVK